MQADAGQAVFLQCAEQRSIQLNRTFCRFEQGSHHLEQRCFPRPGWSHNQDNLTWCHLKRDITDGRDEGGARPIVLGEMRDVQCRLVCHVRAPLKTMAGSSPAICRMGNRAESAAITSDTIPTLSNDAPLICSVMVDDRFCTATESRKVSVSARVNPTTTLESACAKTVPYRYRLRAPTAFRMPYSPRRERVAIYTVSAITASPTRNPTRFMVVIKSVTMSLTIFRSCVANASRDWAVTPDTSSSIRVATASGETPALTFTSTKLTVGICAPVDAALPICMFPRIRAKSSMEMKATELSKLPVPSERPAMVSS